jgi:ATP-dependent helicase HrpA
VDRARLRRELDRLYARRQPGPDFTRRIAQVGASLATSLCTVERLRALPLDTTFEPSLPITAHAEEITKALEHHQVLILCGATGSGKTTQLPKICLAAGRGAAGLIGHTQPRRIAARAIASRLAAELRTTVGGAVGYQVRFNERVGPDCRIKLMTDGILLRELEHDRTLDRYDTLIIDEAHERSLNIDFLLGVLKGVLARRPELRLIVTSATIDPQRFANFFGGAPIIEVSGRSFPVEVRYRPLSSADDDAATSDEAAGGEERELSLPEGVVAAVKELDRAAQGMRGDVLVFLPGEKQIRECADALTRAKLFDTEILPLYSRLSTRDQERIFEGHRARRVVLATNVAETSLTVPGVRYVVDSGLARISRYSVRSKIQRLPIEPISMASADQRKGRCGREAPGICIRLYSETEFATRDAFTAPEVLRTNLASVILQMASLRLGDPEAFPFVDPPDTRLINDGYRLLQELKAVDGERRVTALGRQIATLPLDPRLARMLLAAAHLHCVNEMLVITAFLAAQDPRERPSDAAEQADERHAVFADPRSDFISILNLWNAFSAQAAELSGNQLRKWCRGNFLSFMRLREWQELQEQLQSATRELELKANQAPANYADLHHAVLSGFLGNIGVREENRDYLGARGIRYTIAPGSPLASKPQRWVVAASLVETTRLYARTVAAVEPAWIEAAGQHLLKRAYGEPFWYEERGYVAASESVALYGLVLAKRERANFGRVNPAVAHEIFVREALVEGRSRLRGAFLEHNRELQQAVERIEAKLRRRDVLVEEQARTAFYAERVPPDINSIAAFERWYNDKGNALSGQSPDARLRMQLGDLMQRDVPEVTAESHPDTWEVSGNRLPLEYSFEPGTPTDGVTMEVPEPLLPLLSAGRLGWLIPGWRLEKVTALLRALPKALRKHFVPVPDHAARCVEALDMRIDFDLALARWIEQEGGVAISADTIAALSIPDHLRFNLRVVDLQGRRLAMGRDLTALRRELRSRPSFTPHAPAAAGPPQIKRWDFGELTQEHLIEGQGVRYVTFPAIHDLGDRVELIEAKSLAQAEHVSRQGVMRLAALQLPEQFKYLERRVAEDRDLTLLGRVQVEGVLSRSMAEQVFLECFATSPLPRDRAAFEARLDARRGDLGMTFDKLSKHVREILLELRAVRQALEGLATTAPRAALDDVREQLQTFIPPGFPRSAPSFLLPHLPRFLRAMQRRVQRLPAGAKRDAELMAKYGAALNAVRALNKDRLPHEPRPELERLWWMIEEFRVSLFAQELKTALPVSEKRLAEQLEKVRAEAAAS